MVLQARKHARLAAQVAGQEPRSWKGSGRGRGRGSGWEDSGWGQDHRGKGKKGDKGKGRGKMGGKGQQAGRYSRRWTHEGEAARKVRRCEETKEALAKAVQLRDTEGSILESSSAFCGEVKTSATVPPGLRGSFERCTCFKRVGCGACMVGHCWQKLGLSLMVSLRPFGPAGNIAVQAKTRSTPLRARGATFPLREGDLQEFVEAMKASTLAEATTEDAVRRWCVEAWMFLVFMGLNALSGVAPRPGSGRWTVMEAQAAASIRRGVDTRCQKDVGDFQSSEEAWKKDMGSRMVGYSGEEGCSL